MRLNSVLLAVAVLIVACGSDDLADDSASSTTSSTTVDSSLPPPATPTTEVDDESAELADLLAAVVAQRVLVDNSFGGQDVFERINIVDTLATADSEASIAPNLDASVNVAARAAIEDALAPIAVSWVASLEEVIGDGELPSYEDVGAILTLGVPAVEGDTAEVTTNLWCGGLCGIGGTHQLERTPSGSWIVTGTVGAVLMS